MPKPPDGFSMAKGSIPFTEPSSLCSHQGPEPSPGPYLLGQPRIPLHDPVKLRQYLTKELWAADLEQIANRLWMMSTQSHTNISTLHQQRVKGRVIVITEDPRLHLVWIYDRVFIKPLPRYLCSFDFWKDYLVSDQSPLRGSSPEEQERFLQLYQSILGFLRTYYYLIQHESDFEIACNKDVRLLPPGISWLQFCEFSRDLDKIEDALVSQRYLYGELRLTRLNLYAKLWLRRYHYEPVHGQYGPFFARFYGPLLFVFGVLSIILSALQVELAAESLLTARQWQSLWRVSRVVAIMIFILMVLLIVVLLSMLASMIVNEWIFALRTRYQKSWNKPSSKSQA